MGCLLHYSKFLSSIFAVEAWHVHVSPLWSSKQEKHILDERRACLCSWAGWNCTEGQRDAWRTTQQTNINVSGKHVDFWHSVQLRPPCIWFIKWPETILIKYIIFHTCKTNQSRLYSVFLVLLRDEECGHWWRPAFWDRCTQLSPRVISSMQQHHVKQEEAAERNWLWSALVS